MRLTLRRILTTATLLMAAAAVPARAATVLTINLNTAGMAGYAGDVLTFYGQIVNHTASDISLDYPAFFQVGGDFSDPFAYTLDFGWPSTAPANSTTASVDLFSVLIPATAPGVYNGTLEFDGFGARNNPFTTTANFSVTVLAPAQTPEPAAGLMCGLGMAALLMLRRRRRRA